MSIIHEALKKASRRREGLYNLIDNEPTGERLHIERPDRIKRYALAIIIALVALNISIFAWNFSLKSEINRIARSVTADDIEGAGTAARGLSVAEAPPADREVLREAERKPPPDKEAIDAPAAANDVLPQLVLKGTMLSKNTSRAFINNSMVKVGDEIEGAEVLSIEQGSVTLRLGEREFDIYK